MTPAAALFREWRGEIEEELRETPKELDIALARVQLEEKRLGVERRQREQLDQLVKRGLVAGESMASALRVRLQTYLDACKVATPPVRATIENLQYRLQDLTEALLQIDRALRLEEPAPTEAPPPPRGNAPAAFEPIEMPILPPPRGVA
jgi:hypothetical protein